MSVVAPLIAAALPFVVWPLELLLPSPAVVEELAKAATIFFFNRSVPRFNPLRTALVMGVMFALSESVMYMFNIISVGNLSTLFLRLLITIPLHTSTSLLIAKNIFASKKQACLGILGAIALHAVFNWIIRSYSAALPF